MGIPKFFRWISERYPLINRKIDGNVAQEFDNLYLDMNGIIHNCTHPNDLDPTKNEFTQDEMMIAVFKYLDNLFSMIRPRQLLFMAIDGVAPRAKMNQQRARRFRSARERLAAFEKAKKEGSVTKEADEIFDSNCITPGTEFMAKLTVHMNYYIRSRLSTRPEWRDVEIVFSGHENPGEGEHKVMEYIRYKKSLPGWNANQSHCLYGLDADLIMLGLVTHEPHFALLREEVIFGPRRKSHGPTKFQLLHISLLREYLDLDFGCLKEDGVLPFGYDLERIIDDFVFMCYFVGNDFLPQLPYLDIADNALDRMFVLYKEMLPNFGGYLSESGQINFERCESFIAALSANEKEILEEKMAKLSKRDFGRRSRASRKPKDVPEPTTAPGVPVMDGTLRPTVEEDSEDDGESDTARPSSTPADVHGSGVDQEEHTESVEGVAAEPEAVAPSSMAGVERDLVPFDFGGDTPDSTVDESLESGVESEELEEEIALVTDVVIKNGELDAGDAWKEEYYQSKFGKSRGDKEFMHSLCLSYLEGLAWVLRYYYDGCVSWGWFFPYHFAPLASDLVNLSTYDIEFDIGSPFFPFQQLLSVLPKGSKQLLPEAYQNLMTNPDSPLADMYPEDFKIDMNGKKNAWEGVVLVPFIDQDVLVDASKSVGVSGLSLEEAARNKFGGNYVFRHSDRPSAKFPSSLPGLFPDIAPCFVSIEEMVYDVSVELKPFALPDGVRMHGDALPRIPTLHTKSHVGTVVASNVTVFNSGSRRPSLALDVFDVSTLQLLGLNEELFRAATSVVFPNLLQAEELAASSSGDTEEAACTEDGEVGGVLQDVEHSDEEVAGDDGEDGNKKKERKRKRRKNAKSSLNSAQLRELTAAAASRFVGRVVMIEWPYCHEAMVSAVASEVAYGCVGAGGEAETRAITPDEIKEFHRQQKIVADELRFKQAVNAGKMTILLLVHRLKGLKEKSDGSRELSFESMVQWYPLQLVVPEELYMRVHRDPRYTPRAPLQPEELFAPGSSVLCQSGQFRGSMCEVVGLKKGKVQVKVNIATTKMPNLLPFANEAMTEIASAEIRYLGNRELSRATRLSTSILGRLTARLFVDRSNIGLDFKSSREEVLLGYARRAKYGGWSFSPLALEVIQEYIEAFPDLFETLRQHPELFEKDRPTASAVFPHARNPEARLKEVVKWIRSRPFYDEPRVSASSELLSRELIAKVKKEVETWRETCESKAVRLVTREMAPSMLLRPLRLSDLQPEGESKQQFSPCDRVVYLVGDGIANFGDMATVIGLVNNLVTLDFDKPQISGGSLGGLCRPYCGIQGVPYHHLLNLSNYKPKANPVRHRQSSDRGALRYSSDRGGGALRHSSDQGGLRQSSDRGGLRQSNDRGGMRQSNDRGGMRHSNDRGGLRQSTDRGSSGGGAGRGRVKIMQREQHSGGHRGGRTSARGGSNAGSSPVKAGLRPPSSFSAPSAPSSSAQSSPPGGAASQPGSYGIKISPSDLFGSPNVGAGLSAGGAGLHPASAAPSARGADMPPDGVVATHKPGGGLPMPVPSYGGNGAFPQGLPLPVNMARTGAAPHGAAPVTYQPPAQHGGGERYPNAGYNPQRRSQGYGEPGRVGAGHSQGKRVSHPQQQQQPSYGTNPFPAQAASASVEAQMASFFASLPGAKAESSGQRPPTAGGPSTHGDSEQMPATQSGSMHATASVPHDPAIVTASVHGGLPFPAPQGSGMQHPAPYGGLERGQVGGLSALPMPRPGSGNAPHSAFPPHQFAPPAQQHRGEGGRGATPLDFIRQAAAQTPQGGGMPLQMPYPAPAAQAQGVGVMGGGAMGIPRPGGTPGMMPVPQYGGAAPVPPQGGLPMPRGPAGGMSAEELEKALRGSG